MKQGSNKEVKEDDILVHLKAINKHIETIETSLRKLEEKSEERESAMLVMGALLGGLISIAVNLWTDYFVQIFEPSKWIMFLSLLASTFTLVVMFVFLWRWASKRIP